MDNNTGAAMFGLFGCLYLFYRHMTNESSDISTNSNVTTVVSPSPAGLAMRPPSVPHKELRKPVLKDKVIVIGDIHGCLDELKAILTKCEYDSASCSVVLVGDLVNKGPFSAEVVHFCREIGAHSVRGNHDEAALRAVCRRNADDQVSAKYQYVLQWSQADVEWLLDLPYTLSLPEFGAAVVHAGLAPGVPLDAQEPYHMTCMRNVKPRSGGDVGEGAYTVYETAIPGGEPWAQVWADEDAAGVLAGCHLYFGHDAARRLQQCTHATGLDTGCCYGKQMSAVILPGNTLVQVDAFRQYVKPAGD